MTYVSTMSVALTKQVASQTLIRFRMKCKESACGMDRSVLGRT